MVYKMEPTRAISLRGTQGRNTKAALIPALKGGVCERRSIKVILSAVFLLFIFTGVIFAQEFSADMVSTTNQGNFSGKIFVSKDKSRMEIPQSIIIARMDKKVTWILMPQQMMYMEQPLNPENIVVSAEKMAGEIQRQLLGQETIDGKTANKYSVVYTLGDKQEKVFAWVTVDSNIPIKTQASDGSWTIEYRNLNIGKQEPSLFEIPAGYKNMAAVMPALPEGLSKDKLQDLLKQME